MANAEILQIKGKIIGGVFALTTRTFILQIITFVSTFILTILLNPSVFGVYFVVSAFISFLSYFSDVGLAAALIQKHEEPTSDELVSTFTLQQILIGIAVIVCLLLSQTIARFYNLDMEGLFLLRALVVSFLLSSLKTIPSVLLERKLDFSKLVIPQVLETFFFYLVTIILALKGQGIASFAWGALVRGVVGLGAIYYISPWKIRFGLSKSALKHLLAFGIPFQTNSLLALVKDDLMTIFLGKILPFSQIGYIGWAKKWAEIPLRLIMDSVVRVTFPAFSRLAKHREVLGKAIEKSLFFLALFIFPLTVLLVLGISPLLSIIPKYSKWSPALLSFYLFAFSSAWAAFSSPLINALNAIGKIKATLVLMIIWTVMTWLLIPLLVWYIGYNGVSLSAFVISFTGIIPFMMMRKIVKFKIIRPVFKPAILALMMFLTGKAITAFGSSMPYVIISVIGAILVYLLGVCLTMRKDIFPFLRG